MAQDREQQEKMDYRQAESPLLCANDCGFFGCPTTMNLCSKCYQALHGKFEDSDISTKSLVNRNCVASSALGSNSMISKVVVVGSDDESVSTTSTIVHVSKGAMRSQEFMSSGLAVTIPSISLPSATQQEVSSGSTRCMLCHRRVGLLGFKCKCGSLFCSVHRYSDKHDCSFDYKAAGKDAIAKANPLVKAEKVKKI